MRLIKAVEGDNWSEVIGEQTDATIEGGTQQQEPNQIVSPFAQARVHRSIGNQAGVALEMTVESVDRALDEVRPYLISDGGNVEVVSVTEGIVRVKMQVCVCVAISCMYTGLRGNDLSTSFDASTTTLGKLLLFNFYSH